MSAVTTVRAIISGRVQGVFFRASCQQKARELGVSGWVTNRPDGAVEAVFSGSVDAVDAMTSWANRGPDHAFVTDVSIEPARDPGLTGFEVR